MVESGCYRGAETFTHPTGPAVGCAGLCQTHRAFEVAHGVVSSRLILHVCEHEGLTSSPSPLSTSAGAVPLHSEARPKTRPPSSTAKLLSRPLLCALRIFAAARPLTPSPVLAPALRRLRPETPGRGKWPLRRLHARSSTHTDACNGGPCITGQPQNFQGTAVGRGALSCKGRPNGTSCGCQGCAGWRCNAADWRRTRGHESPAAVALGVQTGHVGTAEQTGRVLRGSGSGGARLGVQAPRPGQVPGLAPGRRPGRVLVVLVAAAHVHILLHMAPVHACSASGEAWLKGDIAGISIPQETTQTPAQTCRLGMKDEQNVTSCSVSGCSHNILVISGCRRL